MVKKKLQVFISSTYKDLIDERQAAVEAILSAGHIPAGMELFSAGDQSQLEIIKKWIDESDVFLLILGHRYGSVDPQTGKSYTQLEYEYALQKNKALFSVVVHGSKEIMHERSKKNFDSIERRHTDKLEAFKKIVLTKMVKHWKDPKDIKLAVLEAMRTFEKRDELLGWVPGTKNYNPKSNLNPTNFQGHDLIFGSYRDAQKSVQQRFWATTFLNSGFWLGTSRDMIQKSNESMMTRLTDGDFIRVFLVKYPLANSLAIEKSKINALYETSEYGDEYEELKDKVSVMKNIALDWNKNFKNLQVKIAHDRSNRFYNVNDGGDLEIAIYDNDRVDHYKMWQGAALSLAVNTKENRDFGTTLKNAEIYFEQILGDSADLVGYLEELESFFEYLENRIDYVRNWLFKYETLDSRDGALKLAESNWLIDYIKSSYHREFIKRSLDVGTCTARYPIILSNYVKNQIIGIDNDEDCTRFSQEKVKFNNLEEKIQIIKSDLIDFNDSQKFDLITCMLGTMSHFGWDSHRKTIENDSIQKAIQKMSDLLDYHGVLVVSNWSESAVSSLDMLKIYSLNDRKKLANWTPSRAEIKKRFQLAGLNLLKQDHLDGLDLFVLCKSH